MIVTKSWQSRQIYFRADFQPPKATTKHPSDKLTNNKRSKFPNWRFWRHLSDCYKQKETQKGCSTDYKGYLPTQFCGIDLIPHLE